MKRITIYLLIIICMVFGIYQVRTCKAQLLSNDGIIGRLTAQNILSDRKATIEQLEIVVTKNSKDPKKKDVTKTAIVLLGNLRATEAIPLLLNNLSFTKWPAENFTTSQQSPEETRPAMGAIIAIGSIALDPILDKAASTDDRTNDDFYNYMFARILGNATAIAYVQEAVSNERDDARRQRLINLLDSLKKYPFTRRFAL